MRGGHAFGRKGYKKHFNGGFGSTSRGTEVVFGTLGLVSLSSGKLGGDALSSMRKVASRNLKDRGKIFFRVHPDYSVTKKSKDSTLGGGAGKFDHLASFVRSGKVLMEISGVTDTEGREILRKVSSRCPLRTVVVGRRKNL